MRFWILQNLMPLSVKFVDQYPFLIIEKRTHNMGCLQQLGTVMQSLQQRDFLEASAQQLQ